MKRIPRKWDESLIKAVLAYYDTGLSGRKVAMKFGVKQQTVKKYVEANGGTFRDRGVYSKGNRNAQWKGGRRTDKEGYVLVYKPEHPHAGVRDKCVREHRLVMEECLGRLLRREEVVDHINGITNDNRVENLRLFANNTEHLRVTLKGKCPKWSEEGKRRLQQVHEQRRKRSQTKYSGQELQL